ncbi:hypothetical protein BGZ98_010223 [Dissophora globulifera]|nr:hypothetical protein BGZ98_010223 [Dissophora globulifera]
MSFFDSPTEFFAGKCVDLLSFANFVIFRRTEQLPQQYEFLESSDQGQDLASCCYRLFDSDVYQTHFESVTHAIIDRAIQYPDEKDMWVTYHILLLAGKEFPQAYCWMLKSEFFAKLKYQILKQEGKRIQSLAICLIYEMCRVQQLKECDLALVDESFLQYLLDLVERTRTDETELLNYNIIQLLLVFNEQFMLNTPSRMYYTKPTGISPPSKTPYGGNLLLAVLASRPGLSCTFGENLIFMLNRATEVGLQMLILKLMYLLFTESQLYELFYTNDLHVLVDVIIRELWDLPEEEDSLRHAYLRVMGPLLTNTQLKRATYKRAEIVRLLRELGGGDLDSTLRRQLQEEQVREQLLEQERALYAKFTYRDRMGSCGNNGVGFGASPSTQSQPIPIARWASDQSRCSSPALSSEVEKQNQRSCQPKQDYYHNSDSLKVPGQDEAQETAKYHALHQQLSQTLLQEEMSEFIRIEQPIPSIEVGERRDSRRQQRAASPTTQRLVERVLREWLDTEMKNGAGTTGVGLSVRGVTDGSMAEANA